MNIFHTLAEKAFEGRYLPHTFESVVCDLVADKFQRERNFWTHPELDGLMAGFYGTSNAEDQCMFLLFIGEMYDSRKETEPVTKKETIINLVACFLSLSIVLGAIYWDIFK